VRVRLRDYLVERGEEIIDARVRDDHDVCLAAALLDDAQEASAEILPHLNAQLLALNLKLAPRERLLVCVEGGVHGRRAGNRLRAPNAISERA